MSHNTDNHNYKASIDLPGRSMLEELILCIAFTAGQYGKILHSRLSNAGEVNFNFIMFSNWEWIILIKLPGKLCSSNSISMAWFVVIDCVPRIKPFGSYHLLSKINLLLLYLFCMALCLRATEKLLSLSRIKQVLRSQDNSDLSATVS